MLINDFATPKSYLLFQSSVIPPKYFEFRILKLVMKPNNRGNCECDASYWLFLPSGSVTQQLH